MVIGSIPPDPLAPEPPEAQLEKDTTTTSARTMNGMRIMPANVLRVPAPVKRTTRLSAIRIPPAA